LLDAWVRESGLAAVACSPREANPTRSADLVTHILDIENVGDQIAL